MDPLSASPAATVPSLCRLSARDMVDRIHSGQTSARDLLDEHLHHIARTNEDLDALVTLNANQARDVADQIDDRRDDGQPLGLLAGVPIAIHDLVPTRNMRTTFGSRVYKNYVPREEAILVSRLRAADAVIVGKTATTEFGIGAKTGHLVTPAPRNAVDPTLVGGGSSGGPAAAVASGMIALGDASDIGGSARCAAAFNNVVGFRPTPGRIPNWPTDFAWETLTGRGLIGRNAGDLELALLAVAGPDPRAPLTVCHGLPSKVETSLAGLKAAWTPDFGRYAVAPEVLDLCTQSVARLEALGVEMIDAAPALENVDEIFHILRTWTFALRHQGDLHHHRDDLTPMVRDNIEEGLKLNGLVIARAETLRTRVFHKMREFFEDVDFLLTPAAQVLPYPPDQLGKLAHETATSAFFGGMPICYPASLAGLPALTLPCGLAPNGLPVGLQIMAPFGKDFELLAFARAFESS